MFYQVIKENGVLGEKFTIQFRQLWNYQILPNNCAEFCQYFVPFGKRHLPKKLLILFARKSQDKMLVKSPQARCQL